MTRKTDLLREKRVILSSNTIIIHLIDHLKNIVENINSIFHDKKGNSEYNNPG